MKVKNIFFSGLAGLLFCSVALHSQASGERRFIQAEHPEFSPNQDGFVDLVAISLSDEDEDDLADLPLADWVVEVRNERKELVRTFRADLRHRREFGRAGNLFWPGRYSIEPLHLFSRLYWDGTDQRGNHLPEGLYRAQAKYLPLNSALWVESQPLDLRIDLTAPSLKVDVVEPELILPAEPGHTVPPAMESLPGIDRVKFLQSDRTSSGAHYIGRVVDYRGEVVFQTEWNGALPAEFVWDGRDQDGDLVGADVYRYVLDAVDAAGNHSVAEVRGIIVAAKRRLVDVLIGEHRFSPNCDGADDTLNFDVVTFPERIANPYESARIKKADTWRLDIYPDGADLPVYTRIGYGSLPDRLSWDGIGNNGHRVAEGLYFAIFKHSSGYRDYESMKRPLFVDLTLPVARLALSEVRLNADGLGRPDQMQIEAAISDRSGVEGWNLDLYIVSEYDNLLKKKIKAYHGSGEPPEKLLWDGVGDEGDQLESGEELLVELAGSDRSKNRSGIEQRSIRTEILARPIKPGSQNLAARFPGSQYFDATDTLTSEGKSLLDQFPSFVSRYPRYRIEVTSHANRDGREEENLARTEKRAAQIYEYLIDRGFEPTRFKVRGMGETELLESGKNMVFARYRNERIELRLYEMSEQQIKQLEGR